MKKLLDLSYEYKYLYPNLEDDIEDIVNKCLCELEQGSKKWPTINKYMKLLWKITKYQENE